MENRKIIQKRFCMFDKVKYNGKPDKIRFTEVIL